MRAKAFMVGVLGALLALQLSAFAEAKKALTVTRANFLSVIWERSGGFAGIHSLIGVRTPPATSKSRSYELHHSQTVGGRETGEDATLKPQQEAELLRLLDAAHFPSLNGKSYRQPGLADGFAETLVLTLKGGRKYIVSNYGNSAPAEYYRITEYLRCLAQHEKKPVQKAK
jgi:hypothetical protein